MTNHLPTPLPLVWKRSTRAKRLSLRVEPINGTVIITVPTRASDAQARAFVDQHRTWIANAIARLPPRQELADGATITVEGHRVGILHDPNARRGCWLDNEGLHVSGDAAHTARRTKEFLIDLARQRLTAALTLHAERMSLKPSRIDLRDTRSRWGSCSREGRIMLNWRLVMAPTEIRDYVIIHELSHLQHFNHSNAFWNLVDHFLPGNNAARLAAERWLREKGINLLRAA